MKYFIGKIAKIYKIAPQTIHYYEDMGLIKLNKELESNYRYFDNTNIQKLGSIKKLRNLDVPIKDMTTFFDNNSLEHQYTLYHDLLLDNQKQINELIYKNEVISNIMHLISVANIKDYYEINETDDIYYQEVTSVITDNDAENTKEWFNNLLYTNVGHVLNITSKEPNSGFIVVADKRAVDAKNLDNLEKAKKFPSNKFVNKSFLVDDTNNIEVLFDFIDTFKREHPEYQYFDEAYAELIVVFNDKDNDKNTLIKLYLPISQVSHI